VSWIARDAQQLLVFATGDGAVASALHEDDVGVRGVIRRETEIGAPGDATPRRDGDHR